MTEVLDLLLRLVLAPVRLWGWIERRGRERADAERRVRLEVLVANRRLGVPDDGGKVTGDPRRS